MLPNVIPPGGGFGELTVSAIEEIAAYARGANSGHRFDIVAEGNTPDASPESIAMVEERRRAGATWWIESPWGSENDFDYLRARIAAGPAKPDR